MGDCAGSVWSLYYLLTSEGSNNKAISMKGQLNVHAMSDDPTLNR